MLDLMWSLPPTHGQVVASLVSWRCLPTVQTTCRAACTLKVLTDRAMDRLYLACNCDRTRSRRCYGHARHICIRSTSSSYRSRVGFTGLPGQAIPYARPLEGAEAPRPDITTVNNAFDTALDMRRALNTIAI